MFNKAHYLYTPLFCEENIWQLLKFLTRQGLSNDKTLVLFITNPARKVVLLKQQNASVNEALIWDYHVILLVEIDQQALIFDFDTRLPFATPLHDYIQGTFIEPDKLPEELTLFVRKIPAKSYLKRFHSDRAHMINQIEPCQFPSWPVINADQLQSVNLDSYLTMKQDIDDGSSIIPVSSLQELEKWLVNNSS